MVGGAGAKPQGATTRSRDSETTKERAPASGLPRYLKRCSIALTKDATLRRAPASMPSNRGPFRRIRGRTGDDARVQSLLLYLWPIPRPWTHHPALRWPATRATHGAAFDRRLEPPALEQRAPHLQEIRRFLRRVEAGAEEMGGTTTAPPRPPDPANPPAPPRPPPGRPGGLISGQGGVGAAGVLEQTQSNCREIERQMLRRTPSCALCDCLCNCPGVAPMKFDRRVGSILVDIGPNVPRSGSVWLKPA